MPLPALLEHPKHDVGSAQGVEESPVVEVLRGVVHTVQRAPALDGQEVAALIEVPVEKLLTILVRGAEELPQQERPGRGGMGVSMDGLTPSVAGGPPRNPEAKSPRRGRFFSCVHSDARLGRS